MKKFANSCIQGPTMQAVLDKWGCRPISPNKLNRVFVLWKKLPTHVFWALQCGPFWTNGGVGQSAQIGPILTFYNIFLYKIKIQGGYILWKKLPSHVIRAIMWLAVLVKRLAADWPNMGRSNFLWSFWI